MGNPPKKAVIAFRFTLVLQPELPGLVRGERAASCKQQRRVICCFTFSGNAKVVALGSRPASSMDNGSDCPACSGQSRGASGIKQERRVILLLMFSGNVKVVAFVPLDSRHPSRPAFGVDDWGAENDGGRGIIARLVLGNPGERAASQTGAAGHLVVDV